MRMKLRPIPCILLPFMMAAYATATVAQISVTDSTTIGFAGGRAPEGATWSSSLEPTDGGLVTKPTGPHSIWDIWFESPPLPAGMSWRPPTSTRVKLTVTGLESEGGYLRAFFRYSSDRVHWSTWYHMSGAASSPSGAATEYEGKLSLPRAAREKYEALMRDWWKTDPVSSSDEHEFCVWLAKHYPGYFATESPLIGYVQVRVEGAARRMQVGAMKIEQSWSVSGFYGYNVTERKPRPTTGGKWFFDLSKYTGQGNQ